MLPQRIRSKITGNTLTRYDGEPFVLTVHRNKKGEPITTCQINTGDYTGYNERQTQEFLLANPDAWETFG